jgi:hypothetical protein
VPVYNVAMPLLRQTFPDQPPFYLFTVSVGAPSESPQA